MIFRFQRIFALLGVLVFPVLALAQPITFTPIATTSTPVPQGSGNFKSFTSQPGTDLREPANDHGNVSFTGLDSLSKGGVYRYDAGVRSMVANTNSPMPETTLKFEVFRDTAISGPGVAFYNENVTNSHWGIYYSALGFTNRVADHGLPTPAGGTFGLFSRVSLDNTDVSFFADTSNGDGIFRWRNYTLTAVASRATPVPGGTGNFSVLNSNVNGGDGYIAFRGSDAANKGGIYLADADNNLSVVANTNTPDPGGIGLLLGFDNVYLSADHTDVAFIAHKSSTEHVVLKRVNGVLASVARTGQPAPGGGVFNIDSFPVSMDDGHIAFMSPVNNRLSIFTDLRGNLERVVGVGDLLNGKTVSQFVMGPDALSDHSIAFTATFTDGSSGVFLANVPEPATLASLFPTLLLLVRRQLP